MDTTYAQHIDKTAGVCGGEARIAGTRIRVQDIYVWFELQHRSADEIVAEFPQLTHGDVFAAMTYYWDHRAEIHAEMEQADRLVSDIQAKQGTGPLAQRLAGHPEQNALRPTLLRARRRK